MAAYSGCLSACTGKSTPGTDLDSHSARRPSSGMAAECGWSRHLGWDRRSISLCRLLINILSAAVRQFLPLGRQELHPRWAQIDFPGCVHTLSVLVPNLPTGGPVNKPKRVNTSWKVD